MGMQPWVGALDRREPGAVAPLSQCVLGAPPLPSVTALLSPPGLSRKEGRLPSSAHRRLAVISHQPPSVPCRNVATAAPGATSTSPPGRRAGVNE